MNKLTPITLETPAGARYAFNPQSDITPLESVLISQLFTKMVLSVWQGPVDWPSYVDEHRLMRHFNGPLSKPGEQSNATETIARRILIERVSDGHRMAILDVMPVPDDYRIVTDAQLEAEAGAGQAVR